MKDANKRLPSCFIIHFTPPNKTHEKKNKVVKNAKRPGKESIFSEAFDLVIVLFQHMLHASEHTHIVLRILEDILPVDAPKHHMIDTRSRFLPRLSRHISLNDFYSLQDTLIP